GHLDNVLPSLALANAADRLEHRPRLAAERHVARVELPADPGRQHIGHRGDVEAGLPWFGLTGHLILDVDLRGLVAAPVETARKDPSEPRIVHRPSPLRGQVEEVPRKAGTEVIGEEVIAKRELARVLPVAGNVFLKILAVDTLL